MGSGSLTHIVSAAMKNEYTGEVVYKNDITASPLKIYCVVEILENVLLLGMSMCLIDKYSHIACDLHILHRLTNHLHHISRNRIRSCIVQHANAKTGSHFWIGFHQHHRHQSIVPQMHSGGFGSWQGWIVSM